MMMTHHAAATALAVVFCCAISAPSVAAEPAAAPQMNTGHTDQSPKAPAVSPTANQIDARAVIGKIVEDRNGAQLARIVDLVVDRHSAAMALAVITPAGGQPFGNGESAIAWSSLRFQPTPTPHFITALGKPALAAGIPLAQAVKTKSDYYDVKKDLLGKAATGAEGASLGHIKDLVLNFRTGHLVALVIETGGLISIGEKDHAVAWGKANPQGGKGNSPIRLSLSKAAVEAAPVTTTMAPAPIPAHSQDQTTVIRRDATGNISGSSIPAPATRRQ